MSGYTLIDANVGPYSDPEKIRDWIHQLESMTDRPEIREALDQARAMLVARLELQDEQEL